MSGEEGEGMLNLILYFACIMAGNSFGVLFRVTTFGESHGVGIGVVVDGVPSGLVIDVDFLQQELDRRKPGQSAITSARKEGDVFELISGVFEGKATGAPLTILIRNEDYKSADYDHLKDAFRPSHADFTYHEKYAHRDFRGGGRSSARETAARVAAGAIAKMILKKLNVSVQAYVSQVGDVKLEQPYQDLDLTAIETNAVRCPDASVADKMIARIQEVKKEGDTIGGVISCVIMGVPAGWGEPVFDKLHADISKAMMSINAAKGFEYGSGFEGVKMKGSEHNDLFVKKDEKIGTITNNSGGIQGGISNGEDIYFRVAFKPVATILQNQNSVNTAGETIELKGKGRHDPCVVPRAVPIVEAMTAIVLVDHYFRHHALNIEL